MTANIASSHSIDRLHNNSSRTDRNRYQNLHKNFVQPQDQFQAQNQYPSKKQINFEDLTARVNKPKSTLEQHKFQGLSSYNDSYKKNQNFSGRPDKYKQQDNLITGNQPFYGTTEYTDNIKGNNSRIKAEKVPLPYNQIFPKGSFEGDSMYQQSYLQNQIRRDPQFKPVGQLKIGQGKFQGTSSYLNDFTHSNQILKLEKYIQKNNQIIPKGSFTGNSTYGDAYIPGRFQQNKMFVPEGELKIGGKFEGNTSYLNDFDHKRASKVQKYKAPQNQTLPKGRFQGQSSYQGSYTGIQSQKSKQFRPQQQWIIDGRFQGNSSYQNDFRKYENNPRAEKFVLPNNQILPQGKFQTNSSYQSNYLINQVAREKQIRPQGQLRVGDGYFEGNSSYFNDFQAKGATYQQKFKPRQNEIMPKGKFQTNSIYQSNYLESKIQKEPSYRPRPELQIGGKFEGVSSYTGDFHEKRGVRAEKVPLPVNQVIPEGRFNGQSQYTNTYLPHSMERIEKVIMKPQLTVGQGRFQGVSTYASHHPGYNIRFNNKRDSQNIFN